MPRFFVHLDPVDGDDVMGSVEAETPGDALAIAAEHVKAEEDEDDCPFCPPPGAWDDPTYVDPRLGKAPEPWTADDDRRAADENELEMWGPGGRPNWIRH